VRLIDLAPRWITFPNVADGVRFYYGLSFLCPHCDHSACPTCGSARGRRLGINFWPPIDPDEINERMVPLPHDGFADRLSGDTFETLTIKQRITVEGHWRGHIVSGALVDAPDRT
jgi:hypothetical protein